MMLLSNWSIILFFQIMPKLSLYNMVVGWHVSLSHAALPVTAAAAVTAAGLLIACNSV
jgi:hypothetical protein